MRDDGLWSEIDKLMDDKQVEAAQARFCEAWDRYTEETIREAGVEREGDRAGDELFRSSAGYIGRAIAPIMIGLHRHGHRLDAIEARLAAVEKSGDGGFRYRQIWSDDQSYVPGDFVTLSGSMWACIRETQDRPGSSADCGWKLCVKSVRGRDGRDHDAEIRELTRRLDALEMRWK